MEIAIETVTPAKATKLLAMNTANRKFRPGIAEKYAADMLSGSWTECVDPIVVCDDNTIGNGQHRLRAVEMAGLPQRFIIVRGVSREAVLNIDTGLVRSLVDNARLSGSDTSLSNELISVARAVEDGERAAGSRTRSNTDRLAVVARHRVAASWAITNGPRGRSVRNAIVVAAIARAWYWEKDTARLARFAEVLSTGFSEGEKESAAVAVRNYLLNNPNVASAPHLWRDTFLKVQNAINYFMRGRKLHVIKGVNSEAYPLKDGRASRSAA